MSEATRSDVYLDETDELRRQRLANLTRPSPLNSLVASAARITKATIKNRRGFGKAEEWQNDAWDMYDLVGEFRFVSSTIASKMSQARLYVGKLPDDPTQSPTPLDNDQDVAAQAFAYFGNSAASRQQMIERMGINLFTPGDGWFVGIPRHLLPDADPEEQQDGAPLAPDDTSTSLDDLEWRMLSVTEVKFNDSGTVTIKMGDHPQKDQLIIDPDEIMLIRVWRPHPRKWWLADSPARATLPVLRELVSLTMHISAQVDSRLAGAGILVVPQSAKRSIALATGIDPDGEDDPFTEALMETMMTAITDRASASAVVPLIITVPDDSTGLFKHITFSTPLDGEARNLRDEAIRRLALGLDAPPELLLGVSDMNHWGAWLVQEDVVASHIEPPLALICDAITTQYLHPVLIEQGMAEDQAHEYVVWYDVDHLIQRPTRLQDAEALHAVGVISDEALRDSGGFTDDDAPAKINRSIELAVQVATANPALIDNLPQIVAAFESILNPVDTNVTTIPDAPTEDLLSPAQNSKPTVNVTNENGPPATDGNPPPAGAVAASAGPALGPIGQTLAAYEVATAIAASGLGAFAYNEKQWRDPHSGRWIDMPDIALSKVVGSLQGADAATIQGHLAEMKNSDGPDSPEYQAAVSAASADLAKQPPSPEVKDALSALTAFQVGYIPTESTDIGAGDDQTLVEKFPVGSKVTTTYYDSHEAKDGIEVTGIVTGHRPSKKNPAKGFVNIRTESYGDLSVESGKARAASAIDEVALGNPGKPDASGTVGDPIDTQGDLDLAVKLLGDGKHIRINKTDEVGTLLDKLAAIAADAKAKGADAPVYDLCKVSMPGTNLFCAESKGIPRAKMPQLGGQPRPGSRADALPRNPKNGEVNIAQAFRDELAHRGVAVENKDVPASFLKASQIELDGPKIAGMTGAMKAGKIPDAAIFVTKDGYIIDGHHRWASKVAIDAEDGKFGNLQMPVEMIDMEIGEALDFANAFALDFGINPKGLGAAADSAAKVMPDFPPGETAPEPPDWRMSHRPFSTNPRMDLAEGTAAPGYEIDKVFPDFWKNPLQYYGTGFPEADRETLAVLKAIRGKPDADVTVYRALPTKFAHHGITNGDWISLSKNYVETHAGDRPDWTIVTKQVKARNLLNPGDSMNEFGFLADDAPNREYPAIAKSDLSNPDTPRTRGVSAEEFNRLAMQGEAELTAMRTAAMLPGGLDRNWDKIKAEAWTATREEWGGVTIDSHTGLPATTGYAMTVKPVGMKSVTVPIDADQATLDRAMDTARQQFATELSYQHHHLGVFRDQDTGMIEIDPVLVVQDLAQVDTIGSYTHSVGGAYGFESGDGFWPPYVNAAA